MTSKQSDLIPTLTVATTQNGGTISEVQSVGWTVGFGTVSGTYTLSLGGQTTSAIAWDATAATVQSARRVDSGVMAACRGRELARE